MPPHNSENEKLTHVPPKNGALTHLVLFFKLLFIFVYVSVSMYIHVCADTLRNQRRVLGPLELALQAAVNYRTCALGAELIPCLGDESDGARL